MCDITLSTIIAHKSSRDAMKSSKSVSTSPPAALALPDAGLVAGMSKKSSRSSLTVLCGAASSSAPE